MDREILFRGRTIKTRFGGGEWIEGFFVMSCAGRAEMEPAIITGTEKGCFMTEFVDPATIGQYTGLCDKDGKKIFEGDIVKDCDTDRCFEVRYERNSFIRRTEEGFFLYTFDCSCLEVIGNIHDNPELLGEEAE